MALTKEDLQAIADLMDTKLTSALAPINQRLDTMQAQINTLQEDLDEVKENTTVTREVVNTLAEWTEAASDTLNIRYPLRRAE